MAPNEYTPLEVSKNNEKMENKLGPLILPFGNQGKV